MKEDESFDIETQTLNRVFGTARDKIQQRAIKAVNAGAKSAMWWTNLEQEIDGIYGVLERWWPKYAQATLTRNYIDEGNRIDRFMRKSGILKNLDRAGIHGEAVNVLIRESVVDMAKAINGGKDSVHRFLRQTQQQAMADSFISESMAQELIAGGTRRTMSNAIEAKLRANILEGQVFTVNGRQYDPEYYSELVARTRSREAQSVGLKHSMADHGQDLVQFSSHANPADVCVENGGNTDNVYSLTGGTPGYPLASLPPWHPNCKHVVVPYIARRSA